MLKTVNQDCLTRAPLLGNATVHLDLKVNRKESGFCIALTLNSFTVTL